MEIFTKNSAKCTIFQRNDCNNFSSLMYKHLFFKCILQTRLTSKDVPFQWTDVEQQAFDKMKAIVCCEVLLSYPDFNKPFHIHTDASHYQLGAVISQDNRPIAFYSRKLQPAQVRYTTTERELLSIVET
jgi:hypothetical protein